MLEEYFQDQGREWERFAWLKSRVVAPRAAVDSGRARGAAFAGHAVCLSPLPRLRRLRGPAPAAPQDPRRSAASRCRPPRARQRCQAVARRHSRDRVHRAVDAGRSRRAVPRDPHPLDVEGAAEAGRQRPDETRCSRARWPTATVSCAGSSTASSTWTISRRTCCPRRTPISNGSRAAWAAPRLRRPANCSTSWAQTREFVATEFDSLLHDGQAPSPSAPGRTPCVGCGGPVLAVDSERLLDSLPVELAEPLRRWVQHPRVTGLRDETRQRLGRLVRRAADCLAEDRCNLAAVLRFVDWLEPLLRRESVSGAAGRTSRGAAAAVAPAGHGALADALPDAPPRASSTSWPTSAAAMAASTACISWPSCKPATRPGSAPGRPTKSR